LSTPSTGAANAAHAALPEHFPRCRDPDDNHFLALAWHAKADALVSRDHAVLKLARRSKKFGFQVLTVQQMAMAVSAPDATPDATPATEAPASDQLHAARG
jgi:predicted nucleic acid-binding protein